MTGRDRLKTAAGLLVILAGVLLIIYGVYKAFSFNFVTSNVPSIVRQGFLYALVGGVVFIEGVVIQGFRRVYALVLHLAAILPYYLAIQEILKVADTSQTQVQPYVTASQLYFLAGVILNVLGIVANRVRRETTVPRITEIRK